MRIVQAFGHEKAAILDGGLPRWMAERYEVEQGPFKQPFEVSRALCHAHLY